MFGVRLVRVFCFLHVPSYMSLLHFPYISLANPSLRAHSIRHCVSSVLTYQSAAMTDIGIRDQHGDPRKKGAFSTLIAIMWCLLTLGADGYLLALLAMRAAMMREEGMCRATLRAVYEEVKDQGMSEAVFQEYIDETCTNLASGAPLLDWVCQEDSLLLFGVLLVFLVLSFLSCYTLLRHLPDACERGIALCGGGEPGEQVRPQKPKQS